MPTYISGYFTIEELYKSEIAIRRGIDNRPPAAIISKLSGLAKSILDPVREHFDTPFTPSSGYRCLELNALVGGSSNSQHLLGEAADFELRGFSNYEVARWITQTLDYDQLILEFYRSGEPNSGWVHCSYRTAAINRRSTRTFDGVKYYETLVA